MSYKTDDTTYNDNLTNEDINKLRKEFEYRKKIK